MDKNKIKLAIIGMGYVGLPLAIEFGKHVNTIGFDINKKRIDELKDGHDSNEESQDREIKNSTKLNITSEESNLHSCNIYIVTVPTPVNEKKEPNLKPLISASELIGKYLKVNDIVIYESTVYPGVTEEECVPVLEKISKLKYNTDFFCGYSPERINPGDKDRNVASIIKVTSGSTPRISDYIDNLYKLVIKAGTHKAESIKVAEASKVIENIQRDLNIALMNELSIIFNHLDINTFEVLKAASTKWNFIPMEPGLVGGHCISIDPYYLTYKSAQINYFPDVIMAARKINENMGDYVANLLIKNMIKKDISIKGSKVLIMGLTFKENCSDLRNTKVIDVIHALESMYISVDVYDPYADFNDAKDLLGKELITNLVEDVYDGVIVAVSHREFIDMGIEKIKSLKKKNSVIFDLKGNFNRKDVDVTL